MTIRQKARSRSRGLFLLQLRLEKQLQTELDDAGVAAAVVLAEVLAHVAGLSRRTNLALAGRIVRDLEP